MTDLQSIIASHSNAGAAALTLKLRELDVCDVRLEEDPDHVAQEFLNDLLKDKI